MRDIIDVHSHYMPPAVAAQTTFFKVNWSDADRHLQAMDKAGISQSVLLYPTSDAHLNMGGWQPLCRVYNDAMVDIRRRYGDRLLPAAILPPDSEAACGKELSRVVNEGFRIVSLASSYEGCYLDDERFFPLYAAAEKSGLIVHVHPQIMSPIGEDRVCDPLLSPVLEYIFDVSICIGKMLMGGIFQQFPGTKFIFAHYGGVLPFVKERFDSTYQMLRQRNFVKDLGMAPTACLRNLYFDMSGSSSPASLQCALELTDISHILFGSDFPANKKATDVIGMLRDSMQEADYHNIISRNFCDMLASECP